MNKNIELACLRIARNLAPKDTRNLVMNAIKIRNSKPNSFSINYSAENAYYIKYVEEGTQYQKPQRFILSTYLVLSNYLSDYYKGDTKAYNRYTKRMEGTDKNIERRNLVNLKSKDMYSILKEIEENPHA